MPNATPAALPAGYEPPLSDPGSPLDPLNPGTLAPGVDGYAVAHAGRVYIPAVHATRPGSGDVGRFLDALSPRCVFPCVISERLAEMLMRRGWRPTLEDAHGEVVDVWVHPRAAPHPATLTPAQVNASAAVERDRRQAERSASSVAWPSP